FTLVDQALGGYLSAGLANGQFSAKKKEVAIIHTFGKIAAQRVMLIGFGKEDKVDFKLVRELSARVANEAVKGKCKNIVVSFQSAVGSTLSAFQTGHAFAEGVTLASYKF